MVRIRFLVPGNIRHNSGGNAYNEQLAEAMEALGATVEFVAVEGTWPDAGARERRRLGSLIGAPEPSARPGSAVGMVDGLVAVGAPDELESAARAGRETWVLVHMVVPETSGHRALEDEARALRAASGVICTSSSAAADLEKRHSLRGIHVALPGTRREPRAPLSSPPHMIAVAALLPNKDQLLVLDALARLQDLDWTASLVGSDQADPEYAALVRSAIAAHGLEQRVRLTGELAGAALAKEWNRAGLSLLVSRAEAFGMVVTESLARGIPVVVREGTGAVEALGLAGITDDGGALRLPGASVPLPLAGPENSARLAAVVRRWLEVPELRADWRAAALAARDRLPGWQKTAEQVLQALGKPLA